MSTREKPGLGRAAKLVADRAAGIGKLTAELALTEIKQKVAAVGLGLGLVAGAAAFALLAFCFALAAAAAALSLVLATWLAILVVAGALFLLAALLAAIGVGALRKGSPPLPEQAIAEAKLTAEVLRNGR